MIRTLDPAALKQCPLPPHPPNGDKEDRGAVLVIGGEVDLAGASLLAGVAALRVGAGKLQMRGARRSVAALAVAVPEARILVASRAKRAAILLPHAQRCSALVIGPGMEAHDRGQRLAVQFLENTAGVPAVVDAGALPGRANAKAFAVAAGGLAVLTPHAGEMAAMLEVDKETIKADSLSAAREAASLFASVVVMKGVATFVVTPDGAAWRHDGGVPGLGTSGSGDVLAGVIGGLLARGAAPVEAALWGVVLHAEAGTALAGRGTPFGFLAREILDQLPYTLGKLSPVSR